MSKEKNLEASSPLLDKKRQEVDQLKSSFETFEKEFKQRKEQRKIAKATKDIRMWMDNFIFPYLEGISNGFNEPLLAGIRRLIKEKKNPFRSKDGWDRTQDTKTALSGFFKNPQAKMLFFMAKPFIKKKIEWIEGQAEWIRETILKTEYPDFYEVIMTTKGGKEWLDQLITDLVNAMKRGG